MVYSEACTIHNTSVLLSPRSCISAGSVGCATTSNQIIAEPTPAETRAQWQIDYDEKHKAIREHKATMVSWRASASFSSDKELQRQGKEQRQILHELEAEHLTLPTQWTGFQLDRLPSEDATHQKSVCNSIKPSPSILFCHVLN